MKVEPNVEEDDLDKAAQWAKVKGTSLGYSTEAVVPKTSPNSVSRAPPVPKAHSQPESVEALFSDRNMKPTVQPEMCHSSLPKNKNVRGTYSREQRRKYSESQSPNSWSYQGALTTSGNHCFTVSDPAPDSGQIRLDGRMREVRFVDGVAVAIIDEMPPNFVRARQIMFRGNSKKIVINDTVSNPCLLSHSASMDYCISLGELHLACMPSCASLELSSFSVTAQQSWSISHPISFSCSQIEVLAAFDGREHDFSLNGNRHRIRFGAPLRELYIGKWARTEDARFRRHFRSSECLGVFGNRSFLRASDLTVLRVADGIPYSCQFNGIPIYVRSREDVFSVTLHPPCPSVNDKMEATPELLNKLGLKPLLPNPNTPFIGGPYQGMHPIPGHLPLNGANSGVSQTSTWSSTRGTSSMLGLVSVACRFESRRHTSSVPRLRMVF